MKQMINIIKTKNWKDIDVKKSMNINDFNILFEHLPLTEEEKFSLSVYYKMYDLFIQSNLEPEKSWITVRNIFACKNKQIADRIKNKQ